MYFVSENYYPRLALKSNLQDGQWQKEDREDKKKRIL